MTDLMVGGGAVGTLIAWTLATGGRDVAIVRRAKTDEPSQAEVALVDPAGSRHTARVTEVAQPDDLPAAPELIVFAVKMFDLAAAAASCKAWPSVSRSSARSAKPTHRALPAIPRPAAGRSSLRRQRR